jgi:hypothetical protein
VADAWIDGYDMVVKQNFFLEKMRRNSINLLSPRRSPS